jgi:hypothetical protein
MAGRTFTGHIAVFSTSLLLILNLIVTVGGVASLVIEFVIEHKPSRTGWLLIIVAIFTIASGLVGLCSSTRRGCFTLQLVLLAFSVVGLIAAALSIFFKAHQVLSHLSPKIAQNTALKILRVDAAILFVTFCAQVRNFTAHQHCCCYCDAEIFSDHNFRGSKVIYVGDVYAGRFSWDFLSKSSSSVPSSKSEVDAYADYFVCVGGGTCSWDLCELL